ncbi:Sensor protein KdpD [Clostridium sp. N3C]|nr:Sensor protein KdpD [Clostridium sp. N3C]
MDKDSLGPRIYDGVIREMKRNTSRKNLIVLTVVMLLFLSIIFLFLLVVNNKVKDKTDLANSKGELIVALNEVRRLNETDSRLAMDKLHKLMEAIKETDTIQNMDYSVLILITFISCVIFVIVVFTCIYNLILKPFDELEEYAEEIASGNFEKDFRYKRVNMFGRFTWAFDHMRTEIINARQREKEAIENNKTVIATLSHDIKTPIASIRGYAEALIMNMDKNIERRERYAQVIMKKCDEVAQITNDIFVHSLHDLNHLVIKKEKVLIHELIKSCIENLGMDDRVKLVREPDEAELLYADKNRIEQIIGNIIANSKKYAPNSNIEIETRIIDREEGISFNFKVEKVYEIKIRDYGPGISDEDMPFVFEKFYRGKNVGNQPGAGLGLFIVNYICEQMGGKVSLENDNGLIVRLYFPVE